jgi:hypothetical protein
MKKWLAAILIIILVILSAMYFFIPSQIHINSSILIETNPQGLKRVLFSRDWSNWWPENDKLNDSDSLGHYSYKGYAYNINGIKISTINIMIRNETVSASTALNIFPVKEHTVQLHWDGVILTSNNPFKRVNVYFQSKKIQKDIDSLMQHMKSVFSKIENVYGFKIHQEAVKDSILVSTNGTTNSYPSTEYVYNLLQQLRDYIKSQSAMETGNPMLNVHTTDSINYLTRVAIPIDKRLPSVKNIEHKWMMGGGKILVAEVRGGPSSINNALRQMENYIHDYGRTVPAIPFQSLVTDRLNLPDTTKWITKIYYPVM